MKHEINEDCIIIDYIDSVGEKSGFVIDTEFVLYNLNTTMAFELENDEDGIPFINFEKLEIETIIKLIEYAKEQFS